MTRAAAGTLPAFLLLALLAAPAPARADDPPPAEPERASWWRRLWPSAQPTPAEEPAPTPAPRTRVAPAGAEVPPEAVTPTELPASLHRVQKRLRTSPLAREPQSRAWLDYLDTGRATPAELNATAIFLAGRGMLEEAEAFAEVASKGAPDLPDVWVNLGTIRQKRGDPGGARSAYERALSLDPNHALAHYNLGVLHDLADDYDAAIEEYRIALTLDPGLADPHRNPQVVNNDKLLPVSVLLYQQRAGAMGLPLVPLPGGPSVPSPTVAPLPPGALPPPASEETTLPVPPPRRKGA